MTYEPQEEEYILLIGRGLSAFGAAEMVVGEIFTVALEAANSKTAERVFWSVNSQEVRTAMTTAALKEVFARLPKDSRLPTMWADIAASLPKHASNRNELAHGSWLFVGWASRKCLKQDQFFAPYYGKNRVDIEPHSMRPGYDPRPKKRLYIPDLKARIKEYTSLQLELRKFLNLLSAEMWQLANSPREPEAPLRRRKGHPSTTPSPQGTRPQRKPPQE